MAADASSGSLNAIETIEERNICKKSRDVVTLASRDQTVRSRKRAKDPARVVLEVYCVDVVAVFKVARATSL